MNKLKHSNKIIHLDNVIKIIKTEEDTSKDRDARLNFTYIGGGAESVTGTQAEIDALWEKLSYDAVQI